MSRSWSNAEEPEPTPARLGFLGSVLDSMGDAVLVTEAHPVEESGLKVVYTNEAFTRITGYTREETLGGSPHILWGEKTDRARLGGIQAALANREPARTKLLGYRKSGTEFLAELDISPITDERGGATCSVWTLRSVAEHQQEHETPKEVPEESYQFLCSVVRNSPDITTIIGADGTISYESPAVERILGYKPEELVGTSVLDLVHPDDAELVKYLLLRVLEGGGTPNSRLEFRCRHADGSWRRLEVVIANLMDVPGVRGILVNSRDVGGRKWAEGSIKESYELLEAVIDNTTDTVFVKDLEGRYRLINQAGAEALGKSVEEIIGKDEVELFSGDGRETMERDREVLTSGETRTTEDTRMIEGQRRTYLSTEGPYRDARGNITGFFGLARDITDRKEIEDALREREARLKASQKIAQVGHWEQVIGGELYWSDEHFRIFGFAPQQFVPTYKDFFERVHPDDVELVERSQKEFRNAQNDPRPGVEHRIIRPDGEVRVVYNDFEMSRDEEGRPVKISGTVQDITGREKMREELRDSEARYRSLVELSPDAVVVHSGGEVVYVNAAGVKLYGASSPAEIIGKNPLDFVHPDYREAVQARMAGHVEKGGPAPLMEQKYIRADGSIIDVEVSGVPINYDGKPAAQVVIRDITGRKRVEAALRESEKRFSALIRHGWDIVSILEPDGTIRYESPAIERVLGYKPEEMVGTNAFYYLHPDDAEMVADKYREGVANDESVVPIEARFLCADGSYKHLEAVSNFLVEDPDVQGVIINSRDITERKEAEEALRNSEAQFRSLVQNMPGILAVLDARGNTRYLLNPPGARVLDYNDEERLKMNVLAEVVHPDERERARALLQKALSAPGFTTPPTVFRARTGDGSWRWLTVICTNLLEDPSVEGLVVSAWDVTEQKEAEEALRESEDRFRQLFTQSVDILVVHDGDGRIFDCNGAACCALGYSREEMLSLSIQDLDRNTLPEEERRARRMNGGTLWQRALAGDLGVQDTVVKTELRRKNGSEFPAEIRVGGVDYGGRRMILASTRDVSERRRLEERLVHQATHDPLTDLPNRRMFMDDLEHVIERARQQGTNAVVLFVDLDDFKQVNDTFGHEAGDRLLVTVAKRLKGCLRPDDTATRLGGDEFVVVFKDISSEAEAARATKRIREALSSPFELDGQKISLTASVGVALAEPNVRPELQAEDLFKEADAAMYRAKKAGKNQHNIFHPKTNGEPSDEDETP